MFDLCESDLQELLNACDVRQTRTGRGAKNYRSTTHSARQILFHLGILDRQTPPAFTALTLEQRMADVRAALRPAFVAYLIFRTDLPRPQRFLSRYLPVDADRKLTAALSGSLYRLAAGALLVQRACGLRIGELLDLELDCIHEIPGQGSWLKVPLGKLDSERMVPLDEEILTLVDRITATRSPGRPMVHPRTGAPADFLFTHHAKRLSQNAVRQELNRAADTAGLDTSHRINSDTPMPPPFNAGVSLQALMALRGHVSTK